MNAGVEKTLRHLEMRLRRYGDGDGVDKPGHVARIGKAGYTVERRHVARPFAVAVGHRHQVGGGRCRDLGGMEFTEMAHAGHAHF